MPLLKRQAATPAAESAGDASTQPPAVSNKYGVLPMTQLQMKLPPPTSPAPASPHDAVVTNLLSRAQRPPPPSRSASLPGPQFPHPPHERSASDTEEIADDARPVTALLDGPLEPSGGRVTRALAAQIEAVILAQEEIGRAHLALENVGGSSGGADSQKKSSNMPKDFDDLEKRAASVNEIMNKLSELSVSLKTYHAIGTPVISFPRRFTSQGSGVTSPVSKSTPQISIANPGVAQYRAATRVSSSSAMATGSSRVPSPGDSAAPSGAASTIHSAASAPGPGPVVATAVSASAPAATSTTLLGPPPSATLPVPVTPTSSSTARLRPTVWIQRSGVQDASAVMTESPAELTSPPAAGPSGGNSTGP